MKNSEVVPKNEKYIVKVVPKYGALTFEYKDCSKEHAERLVEISNRVWEGDATITMKEQK